MSEIVAFEHGGIPVDEARARIADLEAQMREMPQVELPLVHRFLKGVYAREMFIPKGTLAVGKIHASENLIIVSQGDIAILTENGAQRIRAPYAAISPALTKRVVYAHEDTVVTTIHATEETDLEKLEAELILPNFPVPLTNEEILLLKDGLT